tara:strand:+ start:1999 stop:3402 length:1404 start_codon:yes stop_codon:yes gene_type:complete
MFKFSLIYVGSFCFVLSLLSFFNIIYSYYFEIFNNIEVYTYTLIISLVFSSLFFFKKSEFKKISIYEKIISVILGYFILPLIISIPYYFGLNYLSFIDSYFEAISGFTSTGFSIFENVKHLDQSLLLWRSTSQWFGGLYFLISILFLIDIYDDNYKKILTNFISLDISEIIKQSTKILFVYTFITFILFLIYKIINFRSFDAFNLAMTVISSGGFLIVNNISEILQSNYQVYVFSLSMLVSFFGILLPYNIILLKKKDLLVFTEDFYLLLYFIFLLAIFFIFFNQHNSFSITLFSLITSISNIGFSFNDFNNNNFIFFILVIIGGSLVSTSSGLRFFKIFLLCKFSFNELVSHSKPNHVLLNKVLFSKIKINLGDINKYFFTVIIFILSLVLLIFLLTLLNIEFTNAFKLGILTLMNTVNSSLYGLENTNFADFSISLKFILITFMIVGRIEFITILILIKKFVFKN